MSANEAILLAWSRLNPEKLKQLHRVERELLAILDRKHEDGINQSELVRQAAERQGVTGRTMRRKLAEDRSAGLPGLIDSLATRKYASWIDPRWDKACLVVLAELVFESTPTKKAVFGRVQHLLDEEFGSGTVSIPSRTLAYERVDELAKGRQAFGQGKARRSIVERPQGMYGRLRAQYPGEYVLLDSTPLGVFALEEGIGRWVSVELTVAIDLHSRCIVGLWLAPISTDARDIADALYHVVAPPEEDADGFPYYGVPHNLVIGCGADGAPLLKPLYTYCPEHGVRLEKLCPNCQSRPFHGIDCLWANAPGWQCCKTNVPTDGHGPSKIQVCGFDLRRADPTGDATLERLFAQAHLKDGLDFALVGVQGIPVCGTIIKPHEACRHFLGMIIHGNGIRASKSGYRAAPRTPDAVAEASRILRTSTQREAQLESAALNRKTSISLTVPTIVGNWLQLDNDRTIPAMAVPRGATHATERSPWEVWNQEAMLPRIQFH